MTKYHFEIFLTHIVFKSLVKRGSINLDSITLAAAQIQIEIPWNRSRLAEISSLLGGGNVVMRLTLLLFISVMTYCRSVSADLAETNFVLFLTKMESGILLKGFLSFPNVNFWLKFKFIAFTYSKCETMFHQYSHNFRLWFPTPSLAL